MSRHFPIEIAVLIYLLETAEWSLLGRILVELLVAAVLLILVAAAFLGYVATRLVYLPHQPILHTPASLGLSFRDVTFPAREDHVQLRGWFIPGILPSGRLSVDRTLIVVHGHPRNRADPHDGVLDLSAELARHGFGVFAFDMRGMGESPPAPVSFGEFEQRDVWGAVDFLRTGPVLYPELGRPRIIGGWGVSMGAATLLLAAAREPGIRAIVSDSAYADILPLLKYHLPKVTKLPRAIVPAILLAARFLYGVNYYALPRPVDAVPKLAPRPLFFIHGADDVYVPPRDQDTLYAAAVTSSSACVEYWRVPGAEHAQSFHTMGKEYVARITTFFENALGPDTSALD